ncbi:MAG: aldose 1-epimerase family protein [Anaerolineaceae bacterium]|nr:aldose 1-epimerase family protein [Anaerolineaceae bacterium]
MMAILNSRHWTKDQLLQRVGRMDQLAGIRRSELMDGKGRGCRIMDVWTGSGFQFQVNGDRAMDLTACSFKGISLAWRSSIGDAHPTCYEPDGIGWLRSYPGGMLVTCGLDQFGPPCEDEGEHFGLHGRISNTPASQLNTRTYWDGDEYILEISGEMRQTALFAENLVLSRTLQTRLGSNTLSIFDEVENEGFTPAPHMILYHFNLGFPLVSADSRLHLDALDSKPRDEEAEKGFEKWNQFQDPTPGYQEQVFIHRPAPDDQGLAKIEFTNPELGLGVRWRYDPKALPYLMEWKMMGEGAYVVGVEPANCDGINGRAITRSQGNLPILEPGEIRQYHIDLEVVPAGKR